AGFQLTESAEWIPEWGVTNTLGVDGISLLLVLLTTFIMPLAVLAPWEHLDRPTRFFISLHVLTATLIGVCPALDPVPFYIFFDLMFMPMFVLIAIWGGAQRRYAAITFFLYTLVGALLLLVGVLYLGFAAGGDFSYAAISQLELSRTEQLWLFGAFFLAFA